MHVTVAPAFLHFCRAELAPLAAGMRIQPSKLGSTVEHMQNGPLPDASFPSLLSAPPLRRIAALAAVMSDLPAVWICAFGIIKINTP